MSDMLNPMLPNHIPRDQGNLNLTNTGEGATHLCWRSEGEGTEEAPTLVFCNGLGVSTFFWTGFRFAFAGPYRVVTWDYRGHGLSGPAPRQDFTISTCVEDLRRLLDHLAISKAVLIGHSMGSQVILEAYRRFPERIAALVPTLGGYGRTVETFLNTRHSLIALRALRKVAMFNPRLSQRMMKSTTKLPISWKFAQALRVVHPELCKREQMGPYLDHLAAFDLHTYFQLADDIQAHDASDVLPRISVPTLVFGAERDVMTPLHISEKMAATIPGAELCILRGASHAAMIEHPQWMMLRLERFLNDRLSLPKMRELPRY